MNYLSHDFSLLGDIAEKKIFECFLSLWLEVSSGRKMGRGKNIGKFAV